MNYHAKNGEIISVKKVEGNLATLSLISLSHPSAIINEAEKSFMSRRLLFNKEF